MNPTLIFTAIALAIGGGVYWFWLRPTLHAMPNLQIAYDYADGFWQKLAVRLRAWWDMLISSALIILPEVPNALASLGAADLTEWFPEGSWKRISQLLGVAAIILRTVVVRSTTPVDMRDPEPPPPPPLPPLPPLQPPL